MAKTESQVLYVFETDNSRTAESHKPRWDPELRVSMSNQDAILLMQRLLDSLVQEEINIQFILFGKLMKDNYE